MGGPPALVGMFVLAEAPLLATSREGAEEDGGLHEATGAFAVPVRELWRWWWWWCAVAAVGGCFGSGDVLQRRWGCLQSLKRPPRALLSHQGKAGTGVVVYRGRFFHKSITPRFFPNPILFSNGDSARRATPKFKKKCFFPISGLYLYHNGG